MRIIVDIQNNTLAKKIMQILEVFKNDGVKVKTLNKTTDDQQNTQEYDVEYEKSFQYKLDRADFLEMKESL